MKLNINFDEILEAFEMANSLHHFYIDTKENCIVEIDEEYELLEELEKKFGEIEDERYIQLPERMPSDDFSLMELFLYNLSEKEEIDIKILDKFYYALEHSKPFRNFKALLEQYPEIRAKWFVFRDREIKNEAINWLFMKGIKVENMSLPCIEIMELGKEEIGKNIPKDFRGFCPLGCMKCDNKQGLKGWFFSVNIPLENALIEDEVRKIMKEKYGASNYGVIAGEKVILTVSQCPQCGSKDIFWDF